MKLRIWILILMTATGMAAADSAQPAKVMMEAARKKEVVDGDLKGAIRLYGDIAAKYKNDRPVAAMALVRMAEAYQKMGDAEARKIFERVVKEYGDQKEAVSMARARLSGRMAAQKTGIVTRQVWTHSPSPSARTMSVSPDGRYIAFPHKSGNLGLHDLTTGEDRLLTTTGNWGNEPEYAGASVFSPDGRQVVYYWERDAKGAEPRIELRVVGLGEHESPRVIFSSEEAWVVPGAWSPDGKWIAASVTRKDKSSQIGLVSAADGTLRVLKSVDWRGPSNMAFSPDGAYLAYDLAPNQDSVQHDIFVLALDGSREIPVVHAANDVVIGWSRDEKHLLFSSDRSGRMGLWALAFSGGKTHGSPIPISAEFGQPIGLTRSGAVYYSRRAPFTDVYLAEVDFITGKVLQPPARPIEQSVGFNYMVDLSPDGKQLAYAFLQTEGGLPRLGIRSMATGETRLLTVKWSKFYSTAPPRWAPDGNSLLTYAIDSKGRAGVFRIDAKTGNLEQITSDGTIRTWPMWASDGKSFFWRSPDTTVRHDLASGQETAFFPGTCRSISPDGRYLACTSRDGRLVAVPLAGGEPKELAHITPEARFLPFSAWTADSAAVVYGIVRAKESATAELWVAPVAGGEPHVVNLNLAATAGGLHVFPDGKRVIYNDSAGSGSGVGGVFVIENLLSALTANKQ
ncbi:MAG: PD40 domain-containing protein [Acidobacteria bacterium]|nr:PD40 domain-containing protein [Acidobacteriota bacterium]